jgi:TonB family protein
MPRFFFRIGVYWESRKIKIGTGSLINTLWRSQKRLERKQRNDRLRGMDLRPQFSAPLEAALARMKKKEDSPWGRLQGWGHRWLARLEAHPFVLSYGGLRRKPTGMTQRRSEQAIDLDSLFPFSLLFHLLLFLLLTQMTFPPPSKEKTEPVLVRLLDLGETAPVTKERVTKRPEKIARSRPKATASPATAEPKFDPPAARPVASLSAPKALAEVPSEREIAFTGQPAESLIQLPTSHSATGQASLATKIDPLPSTLAGGGVEAKRSSAGGSGGLAALSSPDFGPYLERIKKRVQSVWKYPEGISGTHQVNLLFVLDRGGGLVRVEVLDSTDSKLDGSALQAMRNASPFPPIPDTLKELAGWPLRMRFSIDFGVKVAR